MMPAHTTTTEVAPASTPSPSLAATGSGPVSGAPPSLESPDLRAAAFYLNRELSWLEFNARVLAEAENESVPLLERLKFHAIVSSNLDEFFMVRVAGLKQQLTGDVAEVGPDGMTPSEQLSRVSARVHELLAAQMRSLNEDLLPELAAAGAFIISKPEALPTDALARLDERFHAEVFPILTPIAIDPGHPFPHVRNKSLNLGVMFSRDGQNDPTFGVVQVPMMLPRLMEIEQLGHSHAASVAGGTYDLLLHGELVVGLAVLTCSLVFPLLKLAGLVVLGIAPRRVTSSRARALTSTAAGRPSPPTYRPVSCTSTARPSHVRSSVPRRCSMRCATRVRTPARGRSSRKVTVALRSAMRSAICCSRSRKCVASTSTRIHPISCSRPSGSAARSASSSACGGK